MCSYRSLLWLLSAFQSLKHLCQPSASDVRASGNCRTCRQALGKLGPPCVSCRTRVAVNKYNDRLTQHRDAQVIAPVFDANGV